MKTQKAALLFGFGILLGIFLTLAIGAAGSPMKSDRSRLAIFSYPSGTTGVFDPDTGRLYVYDLNLVNCLSIREIGNLGEPWKAIR